MIAEENRRREREAMVRREVDEKGIRNPRVREAMLEVPRHRFVPPGMRGEAYGPHALPIGFGQTISAPQMVAMMTEALELSGEEVVLEIGTGSGYQAAILARLARRVVTVERIPELAEDARRRLDSLGITGVEVRTVDGSLGVPGERFDRILIAAATPRRPDPLRDQLEEGGILVAPIGDREIQILTRLRRTPEGWREESLGRCVFVPLLGRGGFEPETG